MSGLQQLEQLVAEYPTDAFARYGLAMEYANVYGLSHRAIESSGHFQWLNDPMAK